MAIQEVEVSKKGSNVTGFKKQIALGAMGLIYDTIQISQYTKPEESTIRELVSNAVDSQTEKENAISILKGISSAEDFYISRTGEKYEDSNFDRSYYNLKFLDTINNNVTITYTEGEGVSMYSDTLEIKDYGVGIGEKRLLGYCSLGYSTKRNNPNSLGSYGFGSKVALSTRCDFYTMETAYNGKRFKLNCYPKKIDSLIGKFNSNGKENKFLVIDGITIYYEDYNGSNYTTITVPTKRIHRQRYKDSVKAQLLYFNNVNFNYVEENGYSRVIDFKAKVLYSSSTVILSDNNYYSKPHVVITKGKGDGKEIGISYGYVDFREMDMEELYGNIGIKCPIRSVVTDENTGEDIVLQEGVEVVPSREFVVYSQHTRDFLKKRLAEVSTEASAMIQKSLDESNLLLWMKKCDEALYSRQDGILSRLMKVVDTSSITPIFEGEVKIKFGSPSFVLDGFLVRKITKTRNHRTSLDEINRIEISVWSQFMHDRVYLSSGPAIPKTDWFLLSQGEFTTIRPLTDDLIEDQYKGILGQEKLIEAAKKKRDFIIKELSKSLIYEDVVVPKDWGDKFEAQEAEAAIVIPELTPAEKRKLAEKVLYQFPSRYTFGTKENKSFYYAKREPTYEKVDAFQGTIVYGFSEDSEKIHFLANNLKMLDYDGDEFKLISISKQNEKYFKGYGRWHIDDFLTSKENIST